MNHPLTTPLDDAVDRRAVDARDAALGGLLALPLPVSPHEGYAKIIERLDDLKTDVFGGNIHRARQDALRVASHAMALMLTLAGPHLDLADVSGAVLRELRRAMALFGPDASPHEGWAVIKEEVDELWLAIRCKGRTGQDIWDEAVQVAAMGLRFHVDIEDDSP